VRVTASRGVHKERKDIVCLRSRVFSCVKKLLVLYHATAAASAAMFRELVAEAVSSCVCSS
jgi:hypothetical protein